MWTMGPRTDGASARNTLASSVFYGEGDRKEINYDHTINHNAD